MDGASKAGSVGNAQEVDMKTTTALESNNSDSMANGRSMAVGSRCMRGFGDDGGGVFGSAGRSMASASKGRR